MDQWCTAEDIAAEHDRLAATLADWHPPYAHGVGLVPGDARVASPEHFQVVNIGQKSLPGVIIADVTGYRRGTRSYALSRRELERAIKQLAPAEAFAGHPHPNLWTWRDRYLPALTRDGNARLVAVFLATEEATEDEAAEVAAFREAVKRDGEGRYQVR
ncbi:MULTISPECIES: hypothetical protein [unclassified Mycolicibacterium]|uniref:hypothetical protein n=1 Tax=unclassified Mycolicibacterium TaxID=2636767 RepID=UPI002ED7C7A2